MLKKYARVGRTGGLILIFLIAVAGSAATSAQTLTTLTSFSGGNGANPLYGSLIADANGNLFGTTGQGGAFLQGTVFEIVKSGGVYASTPTTLVSFNGTDGAFPQAGLIADANGNLFGTTIFGGAFGYGTVFEIVKSGGVYAGTPTTLVSFNLTDGGHPIAGLIADANGNLFGTTEDGGAFLQGTVFEIVKSGGVYASTPSTLVSFNGTDGAFPQAGLIADANGNLFGTTIFGGAFGPGTVFEIVKSGGVYADTPTTLVSFNVNFNNNDGGYPQAGLIADADGNLFGTTEDGGAFLQGTVFEIVKSGGVYASTPSTLVSFNGTDGEFPFAGLIADANGNLFGTTARGGAFGYYYGTVFEIVKSGGVYAGTPTTLVSFHPEIGGYPVAGLIADANGNLFGTNVYGGAFLQGTVFEVTGSGFVPPKKFAGTPGSANCTGTSISMLAQTYGGIAQAASALGYASVSALHSAIASYCSK